MDSLMRPSGLSGNLKVEGVDIVFADIIGAPRKLHFQST
jgi:hypothetical protein